jgi:predicted AAA+ superfamily ATPase
MSIKRYFIEQLLSYEKKFPILALTGPRQPGKSTMLKNLFSNYTYVSLEDTDNRFFAESSSWASCFLD